MKNIITGIRKPKEMSKEGKAESVIEYGVRTPSSAFDRRPDQDKAMYVGPSKMESRSTKTGQGIGQSKKHRSTGKGQ